MPLQTGYAGITTLHKKLPYQGGICRWYYTPIDNISAWPGVSPTSQTYLTEPTLKAGAVWYGPVTVPESALGLQETQNMGKPGITYKTMLEGMYPGDNAASRINLENMPWYRYAVVAKLRAGGCYVLVGDEEMGLDFTANFSTGKGSKNAAGSSFGFAGETLNRALVLPSFLGLNILPPGTGIIGDTSVNPDDNFNEAEVIPFTNDNAITIAWNDVRKARFGDFPVIEVWANDANTGKISLQTVPIWIDAMPPATTTFTVDMTGPATGFVVLK